MESPFVILFVITIIVIIILNLFGADKRRNEREEMSNLTELRKTYYNLLKGNDKAAALKAGRDYYKVLRKSPVSKTDESAIQDDLASMSQ